MKQQSVHTREEAKGAQLPCSYQLELPALPWNLNTVGRVHAAPLSNDKKEPAQK